MQIKDKIAKTKPRIDAQEPSFQRPTNSFNGTLGTSVQAVLHQPNHSGSQSIFLLSFHKDMEKLY